MKTKNLFSPQIVLILLLLFAAAVVVISIMLYLNRKLTLVFQEHYGDLNNPMQGFYVQCDTGDRVTLDIISEKGFPLVLMAYNLNGFQDRPLDNGKLNELEEALSYASELGLGIIFRGAYGFREGFDTVEPSSLDTVLGHIGQMSEILNKYASDILCVQAGMLGPWGEWHNSSLMDGVNGSLVRNEIVKAWLFGLDETLIIQLRRPEFVRQAIDAGLSSERLGFHNDALLASETDMGTYKDASSRGTDLAWVNKNLFHGLFGGEMPQISDYSQPDNAVDEFNRLGLTYLNSQYNIEVLDDWKEKVYQNENAFEYIKNHMGSRLYLQKAILPQSFSLSSISYELKLENKGFAPPQARLSYYIVFRLNDNLHFAPVESIKQTNGGLLLSGSHPVADTPSDDYDVLNLGLWVGYGSPNENGRVYYLANGESSDVFYDDEILFFASYNKVLNKWIYEKP